MSLVSWRRKQVCTCRVVCAWDPVGAPAPSAQVTPASSPCKSQRSQCSPIPPSASQSASPLRAGYTPKTSRAARRLEAQQLKLEMSGNCAAKSAAQDYYCESLPSQLGFVTAAPECEHFDSPAHMLPGPEPCVGVTPEPVEWNVVRLQALQCFKCPFVYWTTSSSMLFDADAKL